MEAGGHPMTAQRHRDAARGMREKAAASQTAYAYAHWRVDGFDEHETVALMAGHGWGYLHEHNAGWLEVVLHDDHNARPYYDINFIREFSPERAIADFKAKREIVDVVAGWTHSVNREDCWYTCAAATEDVDGGECCDDERRGKACDCGLRFSQLRILAPLAAPYVGHPHFDPALIA